MLKGVTFNVISLGSYRFLDSVLSVFRSHYWNNTRNTAVSLLFVAPLWLLYELLAFQLNRGWFGNLRTGVDFLIKESFRAIKIPVFLAFLLPLLILSSYLLFKKKRLSQLNVRPVHFAYMFLESLLYATILGLIVGGITGLFLTFQQVRVNHTMVDALVMNLGSGIYEEFIFRFILISGVIVILGKTGVESRVVKYILAVGFSAVIFSLFHYLNYFGESFQAGSFLFRFFAGVTFALLFLSRGLGIATYTHSLYNIFLMFRV